MINPTGSVTINGITDPELSKIFEIKAKNEGSFFFNPQQLGPQNQGTPNAYYTNATFSWNGEQGLKIVQEIIELLLKKDEKAKAQGQ